MRGTAIRRLLHKLTWDENDCWVYSGRLMPNGYANISAGGRSEGRVYAHRLAYAALVAPIPEGLVIDHLCRNRACANPLHLEAVPQRTNLLRGNTVTAAHAAKAECKRGHAFTPENTRHDGRGRQCRACDVIRRTNKTGRAA